MATRTLHVIYDPLCGWCYGAAPLVEASRGIEGLVILLHGGGMMAGNSRQQVTPELRNFIVPHMVRITSLTGQTFGEGYRSLLEDGTVWLDSTPPTMAVIAAGAWSKELDYLHRMQQQHFQEGARIGEPRLLAEIAASLDIPRQDFLAAFATQMAAPGGHIRESRELLARLGGQGFPTFALESEGSVSLLPHATFLGRAAEWRDMLMSSA